MRFWSGICETGHAGIREIGAVSWLLLRQTAEGAQSDARQWGLFHQRPGRGVFCLTANRLQDTEKKPDLTFAERCSNWQEADFAAVQSFVVCDPYEPTTYLHQR